MLSAPGVFATLRSVIAPGERPASVWGDHAPAWLGVPAFEVAATLRAGEPGIGDAVPSSAMASHRSISLPLCAARERQRQPLAPDVVGVARDVPRHRSTLA